MKVLRIIGIIVLVVAGIIFYYGLSKFSLGWHPRRTQNDNHAVSVLRKIGYAQETYQKRQAQYAPDLETLVQINFIREDEIQHSTGYQFQMWSESPGTWEASAKPLVPGESGSKIFSISESHSEPHWQPATTPSFFDKYVYSVPRSVFYFRLAAFVGILGLGILVISFLFRKDK